MRHIRKVSALGTGEKWLLIPALYSGNSLGSENARRGFDPKLLCLVLAVNRSWEIDEGDSCPARGIPYDGRRSEGIGDRKSPHPIKDGQTAARRG